MNKLQDKVAFITGAGSGIGKETALLLAANNCDVIIADIDIAGAKATAKEIERIGRSAKVMDLDVSDYDAFMYTAKLAIQWKGQVDILVNNAGFMMGGAVRDTDCSQWRKIIDVNILGAINGVKAFESHFESTGSAQIVNVASLFGLMHLPYVSAYCMTKAAMVGFTNSLRAELAHRGIGVTLVCPGSVATNIVNNGHWANSKGGNFIPEKFSKNYSSPPEKIAQQIVMGIKKNRATVYAGIDAKVMARLIRWIPAVFTGGFARLGRDLD